ncbi:hypothetical protein MNBD_GAMMA10-925 [hydrothermal vent metagenome]|uniref:Uncharacterized protein n=1 Tax=hydrothermal vent metagenome TaxID=652676 RepID=A0A3B0XZL7_9ZZZZ
MFFYALYLKVAVKRVVCQWGGDEVVSPSSLVFSQKRQYPGSRWRVDSRTTLPGNKKGPE